MNRSEFMDYLLEKGECGRFDEHQIDALEQFCFELYENTELDKPTERIAELEKERDVRDLEQQAKGVERVLCENSLSLVKRERMVLKRIMKQLHEKAKALKEQGE
jgi:hypothetical protein